MESDEENRFPLLQRNYRRPKTKLHLDRNSWLSPRIIGIIFIICILSIVVIFRISNGQTNKNEVINAVAEIPPIRNKCYLDRGDGPLRCRHQPTEVEVKASHSGTWPEGMQWTVLKETSQNPNLSIIYSEHGNFHQPDNVRCQRYITKLCLHGDHVMYSSIENISIKLASEEVRSGEIKYSTMVCGQDVMKLAGNNLYMM